MRPLPHSKIYLLVLSLLLVGGGVVWWVRHRARQAVQEVRLEAETSGKVEVASSPLSAPRMDGITLWLRETETRSLVSFQGKFYATTAGGLLCYDESGKVTKRYTTAEGLPENDLTALAVFQGRLYIGTRTAGLLDFDGARFTHHVLRKPKAQHISALFAGPRYLLIGTFDAGLFDYDGTTFAQRFQPVKGPKVDAVTAVLAVESRIYIGTQTSGLYLWREGELRAYTTAEGLPSPHVTALATSGQDVFVATDAGVVRFGSDARLETVSKQPNLTSLAEFQGRLWGGLVTGGVVEILKAPGSATPATGNLFREPASLGSDHRQQTFLAVLPNGLWALTEGGIFKLDPRPNSSAFNWQRWGSAGGDHPQLSAGHITSLAFDTQGRLWVGYFERGIDILSPATGERLHHLQDEAVREINCLRAAPETGQMLAATSAGLVVYDSALHAKRYDEKSAGLIGNNVAQASRVPDFTSFGFGGPNAKGNADAPMVLATARGLTVMQSGISRSVNAFHGLASNYLYCTEPMAGKLYVGSLGGLMELEGLRVVRTWKIDNSRLAANWINALTATGGTLYIGTYGGGVNALLPTGEIIRFEETAGIEVNPNAMTTDGERLYVGTLDRGMLIYDLNRRTWHDWRTGLASNNVTSIAVRDGVVYVGTAGGLTRIEASRLRS